MLQSEVASRVRRNLADAGATFFTSDNIDEAIQDGYDTSITLLLPLIDSQQVDFTSNLNYYDFYNSIINYLHVVAIKNNNNDRWLDFRTIKWLEQQRSDWELTEGQPEVFTVLDYKYVLLWPTLSSATGSMTVYYRKKGIQLVSSDLVDILDLEPDLVEWYSTMDGLEQIEEFEKAQIYLDNFDKSIRIGQKLVQGRAGKDLAFQLSDRH